MDDPFPPTLTRRATAQIIGLLVASLLAGCSSAVAPPVQPQTAASVSPSGPAADGIRKLDPAALEWRWFQAHTDSSRLT